MIQNIPEIKSINLLLQNSSIIEKDDISDYPYHIITFDFGRLAFIGNNQVKIYVEESENLYYKIKEISEYFSKKTFERHLFYELIPLLKKENRLATEKDLITFKSQFKNQKIENYKISREIYGVYFEKDKIILGDFSIFNTVKNKEIFNKFKKLCDDDEIPQFLIEVDISAKDIIKANEIASLKFEQFENIIAFIVGDLYRKKNVKILNKIDTSSAQIFISSTKKISHQKNSNYSLIIDLDDEYFINQQNGNDKIWELFSKNRTTDLEKRIKNTIEWSGKALKDDNKAKILIQFMFAIECTLHIQPKNNIINSSILSLISDNIAFLLFEDFEKRKMISLTFKDLYQKRSAIVHGSDKNVLFQDLNKALNLCKLIVKKLLTEEPYLNFSDSQKLGEYLTNQKFK